MDRGVLHLLPLPQSRLSDSLDFFNMAGVMLSWYPSSGLTRLVVSTGFLLDPERHVKNEDHMGTAQGPAELSLLVSPIKVTDTLDPTNHPVHHLNVPGGPHPPLMEQTNCPAEP